MFAHPEHDVFIVPSQYSSLREAIAAIIRPSTIMVSPGVYREDLFLADLPSVVISTTRFGRRGVTLSGTKASTVINIENSSVYLSGIEIRSHGRARAISSLNSSIALQECVLAGNSLKVDDGRSHGCGAGMWCVRSSVAGNTIQAAAGNASGGGLHLVDCQVEIAGSSIQANEVSGSAESRGGGVYCERSVMRMWRARITDNALFGANCAGAGVYFKDSRAQLGGSVIAGNGMAEGRGGGIFVSGDPESVVVHRNTVVRQNHPDDLIVE